MSGFGTWLASEFNDNTPRACACGAAEQIIDTHKYTLNGRLVQCEKCAPSQKHFIFSGPYKRKGSDVALRYIKRFGGSTFAIKTEAGDRKVFLRNTFGFAIAEVSMLEKYPLPLPPVETFENMPY